MCGLTGFLCPASAMPAAPQRVVAAMATALRHRGPDSEGVWCDEAAGLALGHRRLAVVDLSPEGHQPMLSASGRWVAAYNGEIYNFIGLRAELDRPGCRWRGHSDTEVLLAALDRWGLAATLERLAGMYAMALWDREARVLHLVRDRLGKKPLYLAAHGGRLLFASELKALRAFPGFAPRIDRGVLALFLRLGYVPDPYCIHEDALKLAPGTVLSLTAAELPGLGMAALCQRMQPYWSLAAVAAAGQRAPLRLSDEEATDELERLLRLAVAQRGVADVPLGAFLSGGIDSSTVVALMQAGATQPVRTYTIGHREARYDEAVHASAVARHLGTRHTSLTVTPAEALAVIPDLPEVYDEPFADESQIATLLVSRLARREVTVALSGDGGDESFGGYVRHIQAGRAEALHRVPWAMRRAAAGLLAAPSPAAWDRLLGAGRGYRLHKSAAALAARDPAALYTRLISQWPDAAAAVIGAAEPPTTVSRYDWAASGPPDLASRMMQLDFTSYLPGDILVKLDRASMAASLEARCPLLDHRLIEFAWRLPLAQKVRHGQGKWLLRRVLARHVPPALFERPKMGFAVPVNEWLRGPLRAWAEDLLDGSRLRREGYIQPEAVHRLWSAQQAGRRDHGEALWNVLMFQAWLARWG